MYIPLINTMMRIFESGKKARLHYYPAKISFETGNICNLRCPLCPTNDPQNAGVPKGMMPLKDFETIFSKVEPFVKTVDLFNWGEPFLNKDIGLFVKMVKERKPRARTFIDTNFNIVSDRQIDEIVRYGLDSLNISCDAAMQPVYEQYRVGGNIDTVIGNMQKVIAKKKELGTDRPAVTWKYLVFKHNQHEIDAAREKARELGVGFSVSGMRVDCGKEIFEEIGASVERDKQWIPDDPAYNQYQDLSRWRDFCPKPWKTMTVHWNGDVVPCGALYDCSRYRYGNLLEQSLEEVWNGPSYIEAREVILGRREHGRVICALCKEKGFQHF